MLQSLTPLTNFQINYDPDPTAGGPAAEGRARALQSSCESDLAWWLSIFGLDDSGFGSGNRINVNVDMAGGKGHNGGYRTQGGTTIRTIAYNGLSNPSDGDNGVRCIFTAELVEVLMDLRNQKTGAATWNADYSDGEGLSEVCAATRYPGAWYNPSLGLGPRNWPWLSPRGTSGAQPAPRPDFVTKREKTDKNQTSYGCSSLFIYYMISQRGLSLRDIITRAGTTLEQTYENVTGTPANPAAPPGWTGFINLVNRYYPPANFFQLRTDDPFPLLDGSARSVSISFNQTPQGPAAPSGKSGNVTISAGGNCKPKVYDYQFMDQNQLLQCICTVAGFAQPVFAWSINGQVVAVNGSLLTETSVEVDQPTHPGVKSSQMQQVGIGFESLDTTLAGKQFSNELDLVTEGFPGHVVVLVSVSVTEAFGSTDPTTAAGFGIIDAESIRYEDSFYLDQLNCVADLRQRIADLRSYHWINILLTLPDPAPEVIAGVFVAEQVLEELCVMAKKHPAIMQSVAAALSQRMGLSANRLLALGRAEKT